MRIVDAFQGLSRSIWNKIGFFHRVQETSLTDDVITRLKKLNHERLLVIKGHNEKKKGADIEWWIVFPGNVAHSHQAMHFRIQAKRLHNKTVGDHSYDDLDHKKGKQLESLINEARKDQAIPLYCFYNHYHSTSHYQKKTVDVDDGWRYAFADEIKKQRQKNPTSYKNLSMIDPLTYPMHFFATMAENNPRQILDAYHNVSGEPIENLKKTHLPNYVFDALEVYEYPNGEVVKKQDWFPGVTHLRKQRKREYNLNILGFIYERDGGDNEYSKAKHVVVTITKEPFYWN